MVTNLLAKLREAASPFRSASPEDLKKRQEELKAAADAAGIRPEDPEVLQLEDVYLNAVNKLTHRLNDLSAGGDVCTCDQDAIREAGEWYETIDLPGEYDSIDRRCKRCGGWVAL